MGWCLVSEVLCAVFSAALLNIRISIKLKVEKKKKTQLQISGVETGDLRGQSRQC